MKTGTEVVVGHDGEIVVPEEMLKSYKIRPGDKLLIVGDEKAGIAAQKYDSFISAVLTFKKGNI